MKKLLTTTLFTFILVSIVMGLFCWFVIIKANSSKSETIVYIHENTSLDTLLSTLKTNSAIQNSYSFKVASQIWKLEGKIKPGRYKIEPNKNNKQLVRQFVLGLQEPHNLVLAGNIRTPEKLSSIISEKISSDSLDVYKALTDSALIDSLGFNRYSFPAMFILNTYQIYWTTKPKDLIIRLNKEYHNFWNQERKAKAQALNLTPIQVTTLASIVAQESNLKSEHKKIAGVYINRLKRGMPLQADPTIKFALNDPSIKRILYKHLKIESPYNTYKKAGLPPGPIVLTNEFVIDAVLNYQRHSYLYFCADSSLDGSHNFAITLAQHNRNARAYQAAISKLK
ncbi:MAG: endolytic transglycosylase MltG [Bacteroidales bacterium]